MALSEMSNKLGLALDVPTQAKAKPILKQLVDYVGLIKVHTLVDLLGAEAVAKFLRPYKKQLFWDTKTHDTTETTLMRVQIAVDVGFDYITVHASAGLDTLKAAVERTKGSKTKILAVTVLTPHGESQAKNIYNVSIDRKLQQFSFHIKEAGAHGLICGVKDLPLLRSFAETQNLFLVTPGIRLDLEGKKIETRNGSPNEAIAKGSDLLIVGRELLSPANGVSRQKKAEEILRQMQKGVRKEGANALWPTG